MSHVVTRDRERFPIKPFAVLTAIPRPHGHDVGEYDSSATHPQSRRPPQPTSCTRTQLSDYTRGRDEIGDDGGEALRHLLLRIREHDAQEAAWCQVRGVGPRRRVRGAPH